jgi:hypothetical protein
MHDDFALLAFAGALALAEFSGWILVTRDVWRLARAKINPKDD